MQIAEHKHLDHTNEFYFLTTDRRTCRTAAANLSPPSTPTTTYNLRKTTIKKQREIKRRGHLHNGENRLDFIPVPEIKWTAHWLNKHLLATLLMLLNTMEDG